MRADKNQLSLVGWDAALDRAPPGWVAETEHSIPAAAAALDFGPFDLVLLAEAFVEIGALGRLRGQPMGLRGELLALTS